MRPVCVTADDYGLDPAINDGIVALAQGGALSGVSVMCHADAVLDDLDALRATGVPIGLHLVFVEERPLLSEALAPLCDGAGRLPGSYARLFARLSARPRLLARLVREAAAQIARLRGLGVEVAFINSHQHVHLFPPLWWALAPLWSSEPVRAVPFPRFGAAAEAALTTAGALSWALRPLPTRRRLVPFGVEYAGRLDASRAARLVERLARCRLPADCVPEIVIHPGYESEALRARYGRWAYGWGTEQELVASGALAQVLATHQLRLERP